MSESKPTPLLTRWRANFEAVLPFLVFCMSSLLLLYAIRDGRVGEALWRGKGSNYWESTQLLYWAYQLAPGFWPLIVFKTLLGSLGVTIYFQALKHPGDAFSSPLILNLFRLTCSFFLVVWFRETLDAHLIIFSLLFFGVGFLVLRRYAREWGIVIALFFLLAGLWTDLDSLPLLGAMTLIFLLQTALRNLLMVYVSFQPSEKMKCILYGIVMLVLFLFLGMELRNPRFQTHLSTDPRVIPIEDLHTIVKHIANRQVYVSPRLKPWVEFLLRENQFEAHVIRQPDSSLDYLLIDLDRVDQCQAYWENPDWHLQLFNLQYALFTKNWQKGELFFEAYNPCRMETELIDQYLTSSKEKQGRFVVENFYILFNQPQNPRSYFFSGLLFFHRGKYPEAATAFKTSGLQGMQHLPAWHNAAKLYCQVQEFDMAEMSFQNAVMVDPSNKMIWRDWKSCRSKQQRSAIRIFFLEWLSRLYFIFR